MRNLNKGLQEGIKTRVDPIFTLILDSGKLDPLFNHYTMFNDTLNCAVNNINIENGKLKIYNTI